MFIIERLFGIVCYSTILLLVFLCLYYKKMRVKDVLIFYVVILTIFAYFYEPYETADLFRIRRYVEAFSDYNFQQFLNINPTDSTTPVAYLLYWVIGRIGNVSLLPAVTALITYSLTFYILYKSSVIYSLKGPGLAIILLFVMSTGNYMMVISNIRTMLAISLLAFCFFRESVMRVFKLWHLLLYISAALIHNLAFILILIRCVAFIFSTNIKKKLKIFIIVLLAIFGVIFIFKFNWMLNDVFEKATGYITGDTYSYIWEYIIGFIALIIEIIGLRMYLINHELRLNETEIYLFLCISLACIFVMQFSIFHRIITYISPILVIPILAMGFSGPCIEKKQREWVFFLSVIMLLVACSRGSLSSLKFFVL